MLPRLGRRAPDARTRPSARLPARSAFRAPGARRSGHGRPARRPARPPAPRHHDARFGEHGDLAGAVPRSSAGVGPSSTPRHRRSGARPRWDVPSSATAPSSGWVPSWPAPGDRCAYSCPIFSTDFVLVFSMRRMIEPTGARRALHERRAGTIVRARGTACGATDAEAFVVSRPVGPIGRGACAARGISTVDIAVPCGGSDELAQSL